MSYQVLIPKLLRQSKDLTPCPYQWVPSLYFGEGLPYTIITMVVAVLYKTFGLPNTQIVLAVSFLSLPWLLKSFLAPAIELFATKRDWICKLQFGLAILCLLLALALEFPSNNNYFWMVSVISFSIMAIFSVLYDIAADGFYLSILSLKQQALYVGVRSIFYNLARLFANGGVMILVGYIGVWQHNYIFAWRIGFFIYAIIFALLAYYHRAILPFERTKAVACINVANESVSVLTSLPRNVWRVFSDTIKDFLRIPKIFYLIIFILIYNATEAQVIKILPLFFLDNLTNGGMNLSVANVGWICGIIGVAMMLLGIFIGGWLVERCTVKKSLIPLTIFMTIGNSMYWLLSNWQSANLLAASSVYGLAQFSFGLSNSVYMMFLMLLAKQHHHYPTSQYALMTTLMTLGFILFGALSGYLQKFLGYHDFFIWIIILGLFISIYTIFIVKKCYAFTKF